MVDNGVLALVGDSVERFSNCEEEDAVISVDILVLTLVGDCVEKLSVCVGVDKTTGEVWPTVCVVECDGLSVGTEVEIVTTGDV